MKPLLVVGSVAIDTIESPFGKVEECFGGSASYFSYAASFFTPVSIIAVVGKDFPDAYRAILEEKDIDLSGLEVADGETFRWSGKYEAADMNTAHTLDTQLNVFENFDPQLEDKKCSFVFLANIDPALQRNVLKQTTKTKFVASDTMNHWIASKKEELIQVLRDVTMIVINDGEARALTGEQNLVKALDKIKEFGPQIIIIKKGEHGAVACYKGTVLTLPAFPLDEVYDPTGAGDSFAGAVMGFLTKRKEVTLENFKLAVAYGIVVASFTVERFGLERLREISCNDIQKRLDEYKKLMTF